MNKVLPILAIAAIAYFIFGKSETLESHVLNLQNQDAYSESSDTVGGRCFSGKCLIIYVAPWCPACKSLRPTIISLSKELMAEGKDVKVIVGNDSYKTTVEYAKTYPFPVYLDADSKFYRKANQKGVPFFLVVDREAKVISKLAGGTPNVKIMRNKLDI